MRFNYDRNKIELEFWDNCDRNRLDKRAFIKAVRKAFPNAIELRKNFVVETAERLLYAYSLETKSFYLLGSVSNPDCYCGVLKKPDTCKVHNC